MTAALIRVAALNRSFTVIHRIEYDSKTDTFVGFCLPLGENKLPFRDTFCLQTYQEIEDAFKTQKVAKYAHCVVTQPVDIKNPSFVLFIMGTDSKYNADVISSRWDYIESELKSRGVTVLTFGADGAGPFLKAMVENSKLFQRMVDNSLPQGWDFFLMPCFPDNCLYSQDTIHILAKLRSKLITPSNILIMGNENACRAHIQFVIDNKPKDRHGLNNKCLNHKDKQNYESIHLLVGKNVQTCITELQEEKKMKTKGTSVYLTLMHDVRDAFLDKFISPLQRIQLIWKVVFFLRTWRTWLNQKGYPESEHFVTANAYTCLELNAHMLTIIVVHTINGVLPPESLRVWKTGSQACEQLFRMLRSMTPTFSTIINFSLKGLLQKNHKLRFLSKAEASNELEFPRAKRRLLQINSETAKTLSIPSLSDLTSSIQNSKAVAIELASSCQMHLPSYDDGFLAEGRLKLVDNATLYDGEEESELGENSQNNQSLQAEPILLDKETEEDLNSLRLVKGFHLMKM